MFLGIGKHGRHPLPHILIIVIVVIPGNKLPPLAHRLLPSLRNPKIQLPRLIRLNQPQLTVINIRRTNRLLVLPTTHHLLKVKVLTGSRLYLLERFVQLYCLEKVATALVQSQAVTTLDGAASTAACSWHVHHACWFWYWCVVTVLAHHLDQGFVAVYCLLLHCLCESVLFCGLCWVLCTVLLLLLFLFLLRLIQTHSRLLMPDLFSGFLDLFYLSVFLLVYFNHIPNHLWLVLNKSIVLPHSRSGLFMILALPLLSGLMFGKPVTIVGILPFRLLHFELWNGTFFWSSSMRTTLSGFTGLVAGTSGKETETSGIVFV